MSDPDVALMLEFAQGREAAFVELYQRYRDRMVSFTSRMLGDPTRGGDAAQEVFLKLYRARSSYEPKSRFSTYLYRIATNHCLNQRARADQRLVDAAGDSDDRHADAEELDPLQRLVQKQLVAALERALAALPERQRAALLLVHYEGMSYLEAAESIDTSEAGIKSLIHRARAALIADLGPELGQHVEGAHAL
jgi:RNA polymerase sigma-70 factor (ECF subfamily)